MKKYGAKEIQIKKINSVIKRLHDEGVYVIARLTVFQDPALAKARPDLAVQNALKFSSSTAADADTLWYDSKNLAWIDPAAKEAWEYNLAIAKDAAERGFDEINFDYLRFASDGDLEAMKFPFYDEKKQIKREVIKSFFEYLRDGLSRTKISADLFGLVTINSKDLGIGQYLEDAFPYFDYLAPMVYPSHYSPGSFGYKNPAAYPYEVVKGSMEGSLKKLEKYQSNNTSTTLTVKLRPWLQDFDLGAKYDETKIRNQIKAVEEALGQTSRYNGWMLWNPSNIYTKSALEVE